MQLDDFENEFVVRKAAASVKTVLHTIETSGTGGAESVYVEMIRALDPAHWRSIPVVPARGWIYDQLIASGIQPIVLPERHSLDVAYFVRLVMLIKNSGVDIIHGHLFGSTMRAALLARLCGIPAIGTLHGAVDLPDNERYRSIKLAIINRGLCRLVFVSEALRREFLASSALRADFSVVIPNGIDVDRFAINSDGGFRQEFGIRPDAFVVGAIGNAIPAKGFDVLLQAAKILKTRATGYVFVIVGELEGAAGEEVISLRRSLDLTDCVVLTGFRSDVDRALASFNLYALTSRSEGFSLSIVEAMAAGLPVVATRCGGPEEILDSGVTGVLVANGSAEEVARAIHALRTDADERRRLGDAARASAQSRFPLRRQIQSYEGLYEECLAEHREGVGART